MVLFLLCLVVGVSGLSYGVYSLLSTDAGWVTVEAVSDQIHCGSEFTFEYLLEKGGMAGSDELRKVRFAYSDAVVKAYQLFTTTESFEDLRNLYYINQHPNEEIEVDPVLYQAFQSMGDQDSRVVYMGPLFSLYQDLFFCQEDWETYDFDPYQNPETAAFYRELAAFAADPAHVQVELLGENRLRLNVSEEYRSYAQEAGRESYLDFGWLRNAFVADFLADTLMEQGFTSGILTSYDGYTRSLGGAVGNFGYRLFDWYDGGVITAAQIVFDEPVNLVNFRTFPIKEEDGNRSYALEDGTLRHAYLDGADGFCRAAVDTLLVYSPEDSCAEMALEAAPVFIGDTLSRDLLRKLRREDREVVTIEDRVVFHSQPDLSLNELYTGEGEKALYREEAWKEE